MPVAYDLDFHNRLYNSDMGRFTQKDPIGFAGGDPNFYNYVGGSPQMFVDPSGLDSYVLTQFGHEILVVDDPSKKGSTIAYEFYPPNGRIDGLFQAVEGRVEETRYQKGQSPAFSFEIPFTRKKQSSVDDQSTIDRARELKKAAKEGSLKYNAFQLRKDTLNCAGFAGAVQ